MPDRLDLYVWAARLRGEESRYDWSTESASNFKTFERESNALTWYPYKALNGTYDVEITYSCDDAIAGSRFRLGPDARGGSGGSAIEGIIPGTGGKFVTNRIDGSLTITPSTGTITLGLVGNDKSAGVKVQKITLIRH